MKATRFEPAEAAKLILENKVKGPISVDGALDLSGNDSLDRLPNGLTCYELDASGTSIKTLPDSIRVECSITLRDCHQLTKLPDKLATGTLDLRGCSQLTNLPEGLQVWFLDIGGCMALESLPKRARIEHGGLSIAGCSRIETLPKYLKQLATLDISDCPLIAQLPADLKVGLWIDVAGSGIKSRPPGHENVGLRWRGVSVTDRLAFQPDQITAKETLGQRNAELRRVMIEQMGNDRFLAEAGAKCINRDTDPGGTRKLLKVKIDGDEDLVCLSCNCPSTGRHYLLRVPPKTRTCHQAAAWIAGFDDPADYQPIVET